MTAEDDFSAWLIIRQHLVVWRNCERILFTMGLIIVSNQNKKQKRKKKTGITLSPLTGQVRFCNAWKKDGGKFARFKFNLHWSVFFVLFNSPLSRKKGVENMC